MTDAPQPRRADKHEPTPQPEDDRLKLARCGVCRSPIGRVGPGSRAELKCRHCGALTLVCG